MFTRPLCMVRPAAGVSAVVILWASLAAGCADASTGAPDGTSSSSGGSSSGGSSRDGGGDSGARRSIAGWLSTRDNGIFRSDGTQWIGRGVNIDDTFFCGGASRVANPGQAHLSMVQSLMATWRPTFVRLSLSMDSGYGTVDWSGTYRSDMTASIRAMGQAGAVVLVTIRSHANQHANCGAPSGDDATCMPTSLTSMDAVYQALVSDFKDDAFVMYGITNEPGGQDSASMETQVRTAMDHALKVIRAQEDALGTPHHLVAVQGTQWTSNIGWWAKGPLAYDNVVYEYHSYPPVAKEYTFSNLPVIIGEYGSSADWSAFYSDVESKFISSLAWDYSPLSDCAPDLLKVGSSTTSVSATSWGTTVYDYLTSH